MTGSYVVPPEILACKPDGVSCNVKRIKNHYYVYEHLRVLDAKTGKMKNASGKVIGKITLNEGFIPKDNNVIKDDISILNCGEYAIGIHNSLSVLKNLREFFSVEDSNLFYCLGMIYFVNGYTPIRDFEHYYEGSILCKRFPDLSMSEAHISSWFKEVGKRQRRINQFEQSLVDKGSGCFAIDGHVILGCSINDDLCSNGNKYRKLENSQQNFMCVFDVEMNRVVTCKPFDGGTLDQTYLDEVFNTFCFKNNTFCVDAGFYSPHNIALLSSNNNKYVIPMPAKYNDYKRAVSNLNFEGQFVYKKGKGKKTHKSLISYREDKTSDEERMILFRDEEMHEKLCAEYVSNIGIDDRHTLEEYNKLKDMFGVIVLQTNKTEAASEVYGTYKKRWKIETYYNHLKNREQFKGLHDQDYYVVVTESFILTIESLIYSSFMKALQDSKEKAIKGKSQNECIAITSRLKLSQHSDGTWHKGSIKKAVLDVVSAFGVEPDKIAHNLTVPMTELLDR